MTKTLTLALLLITWMSLGAAAAQDIAHGVVVIVWTADKHPVAGVEVALEMFEYRQDFIRAYRSGRCTTDESGTCAIPLPSPPIGADGFLRGRLTVGEYGTRSLLWPGGMFTIHVMLDESGEGLDIPGHYPLEGRSEKVPMPPVEVHAPYRLLIGYLLAALGLSLIAWLAWRRKGKHDA